MFSATAFNSRKQLHKYKEILIYLQLSFKNIYITYAITPYNIVINSRDISVKNTNK